MKGTHKAGYRQRTTGTKWELDACSSRHLKSIAVFSSSREAGRHWVPSKCHWTKQLRYQNNKECSPTQPLCYNNWRFVLLNCYMFLPDRVMAWSLSKHVKRSQLQNKNKKRTVFVMKHLRWATFRNAPTADDTQCAVCHQQLKTAACCNSAVSSLEQVSVSCQSSGARPGSATVILLLITELCCTRESRLLEKFLVKGVLLPRLVPPLRHNDLHHR